MAHQLPCATSTHTTQEAGTRTQYVQYGGLRPYTSAYHSAAASESSIIITARHGTRPRAMGEVGVRVAGAGWWPRWWVAPVKAWRSASAWRVSRASLDSDRNSQPATNRFRLLVCTDYGSRWSPHRHRLDDRSPGTRCPPRPVPTRPVPTRPRPTPARPLARPLTRPHVYARLKCRLQHVESGAAQLRRVPCEQVRDRSLVNFCLRRAFTLL